jgi:hypothetical protein
MKTTWHQADMKYHSQRFLELGLRDCLAITVGVVLLAAGQTGWGQCDGFDDGNDLGWSHYSPFGGSYSFPNGGYRIQSFASPNGTLYGPSRAASFREDVVFTNFYVAVDLTGWDDNLKQLLGIVARVSDVGLGKSDGYMLAYGNQNSIANGIEIFVITNEAAVDPQVASNSFAPVALYPTNTYRFVLVGRGPELEGRVYLASDLVKPLATVRATDARWSSGVNGLLVYDNSTTVTNTPAATFDNYCAFAGEPPYIWVQPTNQIVELGTNATFNVSADGSPPLSYQWRANGADLPGETSSYLVVTNIQLALSGTGYSVVVSNVFGSVTSSVAFLYIPWATNDIGGVGVSGRATHANGIWTVCGAGEDIRSVADDFLFLHHRLGGDGQIIARLLSMSHTNELGEAGIMIRESLDTASKHVFLAMSRKHSISFRRRLAGGVSSLDNGAGGTNDCWLRLMRMGNTFIGHVSTNGTNWELGWWTTLDMNQEVRVGFAVCSGSYGTLACADFDNVSIGELTPLTDSWSSPRPAIHLGGEPLGTPHRQPEGAFKFLIQGNVGERYDVLVSPLIHPIGLPGTNDPPKEILDTSIFRSIGQVTNTYGVVDFLEPNALLSTQRFYLLKVVAP